MPLVELIGPPAVGKSTLVNAAVRRGALDARRQLLAPRHPLVAPFSGWARRVTGRKGPLQMVADRVLTEPGFVRIEAALTRMAPDWRAFLMFVLEGPGAPAARTPESLALVVMERGWLLDATRLRALISSQPPHNGVQLLDEGLTHPYKALAAVGEDPSRLHRYAELVPLPDVLVVVELDVAEHMRRLRARHQRTPGRVRWDALGSNVDDATLLEEVQRVRRTVEVISTAAETRGTPVLHLDATGRSPDELALQLLSDVGSGFR